MFRVQTTVIITASAEARAALGAQLRPAAMAAWRELARLGRGLELAHFQLNHGDVTLAVSSHLRRDGMIEVALGLGDPRQAARVIPLAQLRQAEAMAGSRSRR